MATTKTDSFNPYVCAFCRSDVPHGASVCAHCGAYKGTYSEVAFIQPMPILFMILLGGFMIYYSFSLDIYSFFGWPTISLGDCFYFAFYHTKWEGVATGLMLLIPGVWLFIAGMRETWLRRN